MNRKLFSITFAFSLMFVACSDDSESSPAAVNENSSDLPINAEISSSSLLLESSSSEIILSSSDLGLLSSAIDSSINYVYYGTELTGKDQFLYGRFEARMKMLSFPGSVSSMFLYYDPSYLMGDEPWNEIDIEVLGKSDTIWQSNLITREANFVKEDGTTKRNVKLSSENKHPFGFKATEDFHLYAIVWTPEYISWEIDSIEVRRDTLGQETKLAHDQVAFINKEQSLRFNVWISGSAGWVGKFTGEELAIEPKIQYIDYVRVYKYDLETKSFTFDWQDDFEGDDLDDNHWSRGNWEMEKVMYRHENLVVQDGMVQMILSREAE